MKSCRGQEGSSLIEVLFAVALLSMISYGVLSGFDGFTNQIIRSKTTQSRDKQLSALVETLRANIGLFQISHDLSEANAKAKLDVSNLPIAWNANTIDTVAACPTCPGRLGYVIYPKDGFPGLYIMMIRVKNEALFQGHVDYEFIVSQNR